MSIADNIKHLRKRNNFTQKQLAEKSGLAVITIQQYEAGKYEPKKDSLYKLRKAFNCNINEILDEPLEISQDLNLEDFEEIEGTGGIMIQKKLPPAMKEKIKQQLLKEEAARKAPKFYTRDKKGNIIKDGKPPKFTTASRSHAQTEVYELFHSLLSKDWVMNQEQETTAVQLKEILGAYEKLNDNGKEEAVKRIDELTHLPHYTKPDEPPHE